MKSTKKSFWMSVLALILCFTMLIGTTWAWFTDSVTSGKNRIVAGNLDVDLVMDKEENGTYVSIANEEGVIFGVGSIAQNNSANTLWEPGKTQIVYLGVKNAGTLALKYNMLIDVKDEGLIGALEYAFIDGAKAADLSAANKWTDIKSAPGVVVADVVAGRTTAAQNGVLDEIAKGIADETDYFALAVHMKEDAGNEYKNKGISIDVVVNAAQVTAEEDSFDDQYDKDAPFDEIAGEEPSLSELFDAISNKDAEVPEKIVVVKPTEIIPLNQSFQGEAAELDGVKTAIEINDELKGGAELNDWGCLRVQGQSGRFSDITFKGNEAGKFTTGNANVQALIYCEGEFALTIESGNYETSLQIISANMLLSATANQTINIKGGTFKFVGANKDNLVPFTSTNANAKCFIAQHGMPTLNITGGTFYNCNPTGYVADGYTVSSQIVENDIVYSVVAM